MLKAIGYGTARVCVVVDTRAKVGQQEAQEGEREWQTHVIGKDAQGTSIGIVSAIVGGVRSAVSLAPAPASMAPSLSRLGVFALPGSNVEVCQDLPYKLGLW
ncbi:hypothetical protein LCGC14_2686120 [marine sediment metagenome]|uniref:Uncharacterized protein n=1 Tax=marine sediment metagenome TaxID=412755 RepID=A0A0F9BUM0_9ZZZZ